MPLPFSEREGLLAGGNWIVDRVKILDRYPEPERLANIHSESLHFGGAPCNLLTDLALLRAPFPLAGIGLLGEDPDGDRILQHCREHSIDCRQLRRIKGAPTSFTDVMTEKDTGRRTFFHSRGANALLDTLHFDLESSQARIFHLGYLMLLDRMDQFMVNGKTRAHHLLADARALGFRTAVDMVGSEDPEFSYVVQSALPVVDLLFLNEYEAEKVTGVPLRNHAADGSAYCRALRTLIKMGVREWVILHFPEGACAMSASGRVLSRGAVRLPPEKIQGTVGAGDAFAAGVLYFPGSRHPRGLRQTHDLQSGTGAGTFQPGGKGQIGVRVDA
ncbi:MAG TPA: carbohydrate kinase family protein [Fibrobacteria bacterium]|nr:carbohydrate kinase family protein [Fibrobacteria bacterium]